MKEHISGIIFYFWTFITIYVVLTGVKDKLLRFRNRHKLRTLMDNHTETHCGKCQHLKVHHHPNGFCLEPYCYCGVANENEIFDSKSKIQDQIIWEEKESMQRAQNDKAHT